jgi:beta-glucosidase/6-phospho-beta-glucosidase/beta-galactosidase
MNKRLKTKISSDRMCFHSIDMSKDKTYIGMNYYANKELQAGYKIKPNQIYIEKTLTRPKKMSVIRHELIERNLMKKGMKYKQADKIAEHYG